MRLSVGTLSQRSFILVQLRKLSYKNRLLTSWQSWFTGELKLESRLFYDFSIPHFPGP